MSVLCCLFLLLIQSFVLAAIRWRDNATGQHVEYDQRPDVFRLVANACEIDFFSRDIQTSVLLINNVYWLFAISEERCVMQAYTLILAELVVGGMTWNLLLTLLFSFFEAGFHGKATRLGTLLIFPFLWYFFFSLASVNFVFCLGREQRLPRLQEEDGYFPRNSLLLLPPAFP